MSEFPETPTRIDVAELPLSPRKAFRSAVANGWAAAAWRSSAEFPATVYTSSSADIENGKPKHSAGDPKHPGYFGTVFTIEARDLLMPLGFRATYVSKKYADGRKTSAGAFESAMIVDPVGIIFELSAEYKPIPYRRGKFETEESFQRNVARSVGFAEQQTNDYNDGVIHFQHSCYFGVAKQLDNWLAEWLSFTTTKETT